MRHLMPLCWTVRSRYRRNKKRVSGTHKPFSCLLNEAGSTSGRICVSLSRGFGEAIIREVGPPVCEGSGSAKFTAAFEAGTGGEPWKSETAPGLRARRAVALVSPDGGNQEG